MLSLQLQTNFNQRDSAAILQAFGDTAGNWVHSRWLDPKNRYTRNCIDRLKRDFSPGRRICHTHLREYIGSSTVVHCLDGWSYLARAINALLIGDQDCARHLGYYAELRAAMALLGYHGVGVFDKEHVAVGAKGKCLPVAWHRRADAPDRPTGPTTHSFVWDALEAWAGSTAAAGTLLGIVRAGGQPLHEWLTHFATNPSFTGTLASHWLKSWGIDIQRLAADRNARNVASYRPTQFTSSRSAPVATTIGFVSRIWRSCEPTTDSPFSVLDRELLRTTLQANFKATHNRSSRQAQVKFANQIDKVLHFLQPTTQPGVNWRSYLTDASNDPHSILEIAEQTDGPEHPHHAMQVVARALYRRPLASRL